MFEKWSGHETSKMFYECRRHELGESKREGHSLSRKKGVSGDLPRENFIFPDVHRYHFIAPLGQFMPFMLKKPCPGRKP